MLAQGRPPSRPTSVPTDPGLRSLVRWVTGRCLPQTDPLHRAVSDLGRAVAGIAPPPADGRARASSQSTRPVVSRPPPSPPSDAASDGERSDGEGSDVPESEPEVVAGLTNDGHSAPQHAVVITDLSGARLLSRKVPYYTAPAYNSSYNSPFE